MFKRDQIFLEKYKNNFNFKILYSSILHMIRVSFWLHSFMQHLLTDKCRLDTFIICEEVNHIAKERV